MPSFIFPKKLYTQFTPSLPPHLHPPRMTESEATTTTSSRQRGGGRKRKDLLSPQQPTSEEPANQQCLSSIFREKRLKLSDDRLTVTGTPGVGYQSVLAVYSATSGQWYFEVTIEELPEGSHVRIGWSTRRTRFDQPIGSDCFSYAIRDIDCAKISIGKRWEYGNRPIRVGDVIGCYLTLPVSPVSPVHAFTDPLTVFPNLLCDPENVDEPQLLGPAASVEWTVNGESLGEFGFTNLVQGEYYPSVSLFSKAKVRFNFGPNFQQEKVEDFSGAHQMYVEKTLMKPRKRPVNFISRGLTSGA